MENNVYQLNLNDIRGNLQMPYTDINIDPGQQAYCDYLNAKNLTHFNAHPGLLSQAKYIADRKRLEDDLKQIESTSEIAPHILLISHHDTKPIVPYGAWDIFDRYKISSQELVSITELDNDIETSQLTNYLKEQGAYMVMFLTSMDIRKENIIKGINSDWKLIHKLEQTLFSPNSLKEYKLAS